MDIAAIKELYGATPVTSTAEVKVDADKDFRVCWIL